MDFKRYTILILLSLVLSSANAAADQHESAWSRILSHFHFIAPSSPPPKELSSVHHLPHPVMPAVQKIHSSKSFVASKKGRHLRPKDHPIFIRPKGPPPGFEHLVNQVEYGPVNVFYDDILLGSVDVEFNQDWVKLSDPKHLVAQLEGLKERDKVLKALTGKLKTNSDYLCRAGQKQQIECNILYPKVAAVIFDPQHLKVLLFINRKYLSTWGKSATYLGPSTSGLSYMNHLSAVMAGSRDNYVFNDQYTNTYTLTSLGTLAFKTSKLTMDADFTRNSTDDRSVSLQTPKVQEFHINKIDATFYRGRYLADVGMLDSKGNYFVTQQKILGARFGTHLETLLNRSLADSTPVIVSMDQRSQVKVYKEGRLIYAGFYSAGNHRLDTSSWPDGAYDVQIKVVSPAGKTQQESRFFVKTNEIAPLGHPQYYLGAGFLADQLSATSIDRPILPQYSHVPLFEAGYNQRLSKHWGFSESLVGTMNRGYLTSGLYWISRYWVVEPGLLLSNDQDIGGNLNLRARLGRFSMNVSAAEITGSDTRLDRSVTDFDPITLDSRRLSINVGYQMKRSSISLFSTITGDGKTEYQKKYGLTYRHHLFQKHGLSSNLAVDFIQENQIRTIMLTLSASYARQPYNVTGGARWQTQQNDDVIKQEAARIEGDLGVDWHRTTNDSDDHKLRISAAIHEGTRNSSQRAGLHYGTYRGGIKVDLAHSIAKSQADEIKSWQYTAMMATNLVVAQGAMSLADYQPVYAGLLVNLDGSASIKSSFEVRVNNQKKAALALNQTKLILLDPFKRYVVTVVPNSMQAFSYNQQPRHITLYRGNVQRITWKMKHNFYLLTKVYYPNGRLIKSAAVEGGVGFNIIDDKGDMQAEIDQYTRVLKVRPIDGQSCKIRLPKFKVKQTFVTLKSVICYADIDQ